MSFRCILPSRSTEITETVGERTHDSAGMHTSGRTALIEQQCVVSPYLDNAITPYRNPGDSRGTEDTDDNVCHLLGDCSELTKIEFCAVSRIGVSNRSRSKPGRSGVTVASQTAMSAQYDAFLFQKHAHCRSLPTVLVSACL